AAGSPGGIAERFESPGISAPVAQAVAEYITCPGDVVQIGGVQRGGVLQQLGTVLRAKPQPVTERAQVVGVEERTQVLAAEAVTVQIMGLVPRAAAHLAVPVRRGQRQVRRSSMLPARSSASGPTTTCTTRPERTTPKAPLERRSSSCTCSGSFTSTRSRVMHG